MIALLQPFEERWPGVSMLYNASFSANDGNLKLLRRFDLNMDPNVAEVFSEIHSSRA